MKFPKAKISKSIKAVKGGFEVTLKADNYARAAFMTIEGIDNFFSDNYFDIVPNQSVTVKVTTTLSESAFNKQLKVVSLSDAY